MIIKLVKNNYHEIQEEVSINIIIFSDIMIFWI